MTCIVGHFFPLLYNFNLHVPKLECKFGIFKIVRVHVEIMEVQEEMD